MIAGKFSCTSLTPTIASLALPIAAPSLLWIPIISVVRLRAFGPKAGLHNSENVVSTELCKPQQGVPYKKLQIRDQRGLVKVEVFDDKPAEITFDSAILVPNNLNKDEIRQHFVDATPQPAATSGPTWCP